MQPLMSPRCRTHAPTFIGQLLHADHLQCQLPYAAASHWSVLARADLHCLMRAAILGDSEGTAPPRMDTPRSTHDSSLCH
jgi:hypothetical protein